MKILLISLYFAPDTASTGRLMAQLANDLLGMGHRITVVTSFPHYKTAAIWKEYRAKCLERVCDADNMTVVRMWVYPAPNNANFVQRVLNYLSFNVLSTLVGLETGKHDIILCPSPPLTIGLTAYLISRIRGIPFVYNVQDIWPEVVVKVGQLRNRQAIAFFEAVERFIYRKAAHLTAISEAIRDNLLIKGVPADKISVIPNFVDTEFIRPLCRANGFSQQTSLDGRFVVLHAGNLGHSQGLGTLLECAQRLRTERDILFLIVGEGAAKSGLLAQAQQMGLDNVRFLPFQPWEDVPHVLAGSDVQVALLKRGLTAYSTPGKVYAAMASGRALVVAVDRGSDIWNLVRQTRAGLCVEPENPDQLAEAILTLYRDVALRQGLGHNGCRYAEQHLSRQVVVQKYHEVLQRVAQKATNG